MSLSLRFFLMSFCVALGAVFAGELVLALAGGVSPPIIVAKTSPTSQPKSVKPVNIDSMIAEILKRPLFSADRQLAEPEPEIVVVEQQPEEPKPPELQSRLAGVMIGAGEREALFQRGGEGPIAVKIGGEIDGWKIASIGPDQVVLTSDFGNQVVKPTPAPDEDNGVRVAVRTKRAVNRNRSNAQQRPVASTQTVRQGGR